MKRNCKGLTILESLVTIAVCIVIIWVVVPVAMIRMGWMEAGNMVVTDKDEAQLKEENIPLDVLRPRPMANPNERIVTDKPLPKAPEIPARKPLE